MNVDRAGVLGAGVELVECSAAGAHATLVVTGDGPFLAGHYPGFAIFPGTFLVDLVCRTAEAAAQRLRPDGECAPRRVRLVRLRSAAFSAPALPPEVVHVRCRFALVADGELLVRARCHKVDGRELARLTASMQVEGGWPNGA